MITWGMVGNSHDASLGIFKGDKLLWASLSKDFSGIANDPNHNKEQIAYALDKYGVPEQVIWYERPLLKTLRQLYAGQGWLLKENNIRSYLKQYNICCSILYTQHHLSHAAYAYYTQPYDDCAVICLDSIGEFETLTIWHGKNNRLKKIHSQGYPHSLGLFYSAMTQRMGLQAQRDEYLVAQYAEKGSKERLFKVMWDEIISMQGLGVDPKVTLHENLHRGCNWWRPGLCSQQDIYDIAATTQAIFEYCLMNLSEWARKETGSSNIALAGGGALNRQAVEKVKPRWNNVWVPTNPGDPGSCIGAVLAKTKQKTTLDNIWYQKV